jgi:hypothetical protein
VKQILLRGACRVIKDGPNPVVLFRRPTSSNDPAWEGVENVGLPLHVDFVKRQEGTFLFLSSNQNAAFPVNRLVKPMPGPSYAPGKSLWDAVWDLLPADARAKVLDLPQTIPADVAEKWVAAVFRWVEQGRWIAAGKTVPIHPGSPYVELPSHEAAAWHFGIITDQAMPRSPLAPPSFAHIRVFTPGEWQAITKGNPPLLPMPVRRAVGGRSPTFDWDAFTVEVVRFALLDGFDTRRELMQHMAGWCAINWPEQPSERTLRAEVAKRCPPEVPEK